MNKYQTGNGRSTKISRFANDELDSGHISQKSLDAKPILISPVMQMPFNPNQFIRQCSNTSNNCYIGL